jgi:hypothetical protein
LRRLRPLPDISSRTAHQASFIPIGSRAAIYACNARSHVILPSRASPKIDKTVQLIQPLFTSRLYRNRSSHTLRWHAHHSHHLLQSPNRQLTTRTVAGREFSLLARILYAPVTWRATNQTMDDENMVNNPAHISSQLCLLTRNRDSAPSVDSVAHPPGWPSRDESCDNECSVRHVWHPAAGNDRKQSRFPYSPICAFQDRRCVIH